MAGEDGQTVHAGKLMVALICQQTEEQREKSRRFKREMTIHDRKTNRIAPTENLADALRKAREFQSSAYEEVRISGYVAAGQIRAELLRRDRGQ